MRKILLALAFAATAAYGQTKMGIGFSYGNAQLPNTSDTSLPSVRTEVSLASAGSNGRLDSIHVYWTKIDCVNAFKLKFFHRSGDTLKLYDERGPYSSYQNDLSTLFVPGIEVQQGDLIGVARLTDCGEPGLYAYPDFPYHSPGRHLVFNGDVTGQVNTYSATSSPSNVMIYGSGLQTGLIDHVVPVVGSVDGAFDSHFRTRVQLLNPNDRTMTGTMFFHPMGKGGSQSDPSIPYSIPPGHVLTFNDVVAAMGTTGLGSLDFLVPNYFEVPVVTTRVSNDQGTGFGEDLFRKGENATTMFSGATGFLVLPPDPEKERFNIGIRTLDSEVTLTATLKSADGFNVTTVTRTYPPNWFEQTPAPNFFGIQPAGDSVLKVTMNSGDAIIYGATTDNKTNDAAIHVMTPTFWPID